MRATIELNSVDYEIIVADDVYLTFWDADTCSRVQIVLPERVAKKFLKELEEKI